MAVLGLSQTSAVLEYIEIMYTYNAAMLLFWKAKWEKVQPLREMSKQ
jgi:hypothetical protein